MTDREREYQEYLNSKKVKAKQVLETSKGKVTIFKGLKWANTFVLAYAGVIGIGANLLLNRMTTTALVETLIVGGISGYATYRLNKEIKLGDEMRKKEQKESNEEYLKKFKK